MMFALENCNERPLFVVNDMINKSFIALEILGIKNELPPNTHVFNTQKKIYVIHLKKQNLFQEVHSQQNRVINNMNYINR